MHSTPTISLYAFALMLVGLGLPGLVVWAMFRLLFGKASRDESSEWEVDPSAVEEWPAAHVAPSERVMPPPAPRDDREYFHAAHYATEHDLPLPPLPPREEREEW